MPDYYTVIPDGIADNDPLNTNFAGLETAIKNMQTGVIPTRRLVNGPSQAGTEVTLDVNGAFTATLSQHILDTFGLVGSDDLVAINSMVDGQVIYIRIKNNARVITVKHLAVGGNIYLQNQQDYVLNDTNKVLALYKFAGLANVVGIAQDMSFRLVTQIPAANTSITDLVVPSRSLVTVGSTRRLDVLPGFARRRWWGYQSSNAGVVPLGAEGATIGGTATSSHQSDSHYTAYATPASAGGLAFVLNTLQAVRIGHSPTFEAVIRTGADISAVRIYVGLFNTTVANSDTLSNPYLGFRYSTTAGDAGWRPVTCTGVAQTLGAPIGSIATNTRYLLRVRYDASMGQAYFSVNDSTETSLSATLPAATDNLSLVVIAYTQAAVAKSILIRTMMVESD
jgi:hypothetical protein